ncbi:ATP-dependent DNA helicase [Candidatus Woesearchaeota archaeon]|nr:ATP-dependent DNA helicase [Candidatus Woesearchaeota archaeon]
MNYFPFEKLRLHQDELLEHVNLAIKEKNNLLVHAPTGLGKTAAALAPTLKEAIKNNKKVFFLTGRHTQHKIAIDTLRLINQKLKKPLKAVDIIGKKYLCAVPGIEALYSSEFAEYCKKVREDDKCEYYSNTKKANKLSIKAQKILGDIKGQILDTEQLYELAQQEKLCPYELTLSLAVKANVVIADYFYLFNPTIRNNFLSKTNHSLEDSIIIVDEAHNLPSRVRDLLTHSITTNSVARAIKECKKYNHLTALEILEQLQTVLEELAKNVSAEKLVTKQEFRQQINAIGDYDEIIGDLDFAGEQIRELQKTSSTGAIASFLEAWNGKDEGFARILEVRQTKEKPVNFLWYKCLDPSSITKPVFDEASSSILMSGTLTPTSMYKDLLGITKANEVSMKSPFPKDNRLNLIIPETSTKYSTRSDAQYKRIAQIVSQITNSVPGNSAVYFPSYLVRDDIYKHLHSLSKKTTFLEVPNLSKGEKIAMLENFKEYKKTGALLLGVASGSFGEGIDLPGDYLKCVIVVGLPLSRPNLETQELIKFYDDNFGRGWDYGYLYPAVSKVLQAAGRCIRSETDRGVIVLLDERFAWPQYQRCFPKEVDFKITKLFEDRIDKFFKEKK